MPTSGLHPTFQWDQSPCSFAVDVDITRAHQVAGEGFPAYRSPLTCSFRGLTLTTLSTLMGEFRKQFSFRKEHMVSTAFFT